MKTAFPLFAGQCVSAMARLAAGMLLGTAMGAVAAAPKLNLSPLFADLKTKLDAVGNKMGDFQSLSASQQSEIAELLRQAATSVEKVRNKS